MVGCQGYQGYAKSEFEEKVRKIRRLAHLGLREAMLLSDTAPYTLEIE